MVTSIRHFNDYRLWAARWPFCPVCVLLLALAVFAPIAQADGTLDWAVAVGGTNADSGTGIAVDAAGNVYTTGWFSGTVDFDPGPGVFNLSSAGERDIFVSKLDPNGDFVWARAMGGTRFDYANGIAVDAAGYVCITGYFQGTADFDPGPGTFNLTAAGLGSVFVVKLDTSGNLVWARAMVGSGDEEGWAVAVDAAGNVYTTGNFRGAVDFDPGPDSFSLTSAGVIDAFVIKLDADGNLVWARAMGGPGGASGRNIAVDASGNVYTVGNFRDTADFDPGPNSVNLTSAGESDIFVCKLDANGEFVWAHGIGGSDDDFNGGVAVDAAGDVYIAGNFWGTVDFDPGPGSFSLTAAGIWDVFVTKLDANGGFVWARAMGGTDLDWADGVVVDAAGNVYTTGWFSGTADFDPGPSEHNLTSLNIFGDIFVHKLDHDGGYGWARMMGGLGTNRGNDIALDATGNIFVTGAFEETVEFDPGSGSPILSSKGQGDVFIAKLNDSGAAQPGIAFDINKDGAVDAVDVQLVINAALGISIAPLDADVDTNGSVDAVDVQLVINAALGIPIAEKQHAVQ